MASAKSTEGTNTEYERHKFFYRSMKPSETYEEYLDALKHLCATCDYPRPYAEELIKDRFVVGVTDYKVKDFLLNIDDLTLKQLEQIIPTLQDKLFRHHITEQRIEITLPLQDVAEWQRTTNDGACGGCVIV